MKRDLLSSIQFNMDVVIIVAAVFAVGLGVSLLAGWLLLRKPRKPTPWLRAVETLPPPPEEPPTVGQSGGLVIRKNLLEALRKRNSKPPRG